MSKCTSYRMTDDPDRQRPCHCPKCKGFLKWVEKSEFDWQPVCNKCHTPLITIPDADSEEDYETGKICVLKPLDDNNKTDGGK